MIEDVTFESFDDPYPLKARDAVVSVIVTHHLNENQKYLDLCLESIMKSTGVDMEVIVMSDCKERPSVPPKVKLFWNPEFSYAGEKVNKAIKDYASETSKYFMLISDDVMVASHTIATLVEAAGDNAIIQNPMCNGDNGSQFYVQLPFPVKMTAEELKDPQEVWYFPQLPKILIPRDFVSFYCTLIPRKLWNEVGELDAALDYRHNDQDYCWRARKLGAQAIVNLGAFALHFGDVTLPKVSTMSELDECTKRFYKKWGIT